MGKKRKSIGNSLDEVDRSMYASFCSAANSLSQLYTHAMNHQKHSFQAGERHGLEKLYQWIWRQHEQGTKVTVVDIVNYIQHELDYSEEPSMSPRAMPQHQNNHSALSVPSAFPVSLGSLGPTAAVQGARSEQCDQQSKNSVFSNALSSPIRRSLQNYLAGTPPAPPSNAAHNSDPNIVNQQNRDTNSPNCNDSSMEM